MSGQYYAAQLKTASHCFC